MFFITTHRLKLIPLTHQLLQQCQLSRAAMEAGLGLNISAMQIDPLYKAELEDAMEHFWLPHTLAHPDQYQWYTNWEIVLLSNNTAIGGIGFAGYPAADGTAEVGYMIDGQQQCKGFAREALEALIEWGSHNAHVYTVIARTHADNLASQQMLLKAGFVNSAVEEGLLIFKKALQPL